MWSKTKEKDLHTRNVVREVISPWHWLSQWEQAWTTRRARNGSLFFFFFKFVYESLQRIGTLLKCWFIMFLETNIFIIRNQLYIFIDSYVFLFDDIWINILIISKCFIILLNTSWHWWRWWWGRDYCNITKSPSCPTTGWGGSTPLVGKTGP